MSLKAAVAGAAAYLGKVSEVKAVRQQGELKFLFGLLSEKLLRDTSPNGAAAAVATNGFDLIYFSLYTPAPTPPTYIGLFLLPASHTESACVSRDAHHTRDYDVLLGNTPLARNICL